LAAVLAVAVAIGAYLALRPTPGQTGAVVREPIAYNLIYPDSLKRVAPHQGETLRLESRSGSPQSLAVKQLHLAPYKGDVSAAMTFLSSTLIDQMRGQYQDFVWRGEIDRTLAEDRRLIDRIIERCLDRRSVSRGLRCLRQAEQMFGCVEDAVAGPAADPAVGDLELILDHPKGGAAGGAAGGQRHRDDDATRCGRLVPVIRTQPSSLSLTAISSHGA